MNPPSLIINDTDSAALIKQIDRYRPVFHAVRYLAGQHIHCLVESASNLTLQAFYQALQDVFPQAIVVNGARPDWPLLLQDHQRRSASAAEHAPQPAIILGVEKFTPACYARLKRLAYAPDRLCSAFILLACDADKKRVVRDLRPLTVSRFSLGRLTQRECFAWLEKELEQRGLADVGFSHKQKKQLIRAGRRFPERMRMLALSTCGYLSGPVPTPLTTGHIRATVRACYGRWLSGGQTLLLAILLCVTAGCAAWATKEKTAAWLQNRLPAASAAPSLPDMASVTASREQAMQQLFRVWGYDVTLKEAACENSVRANLRCVSVRKSVPALIDNGNPWIAEILFQNKRYYAVVVGVNGNDLDMLIAGKTWRTSKAWLSRYATSRVTLLSRLLPSSADKVSSRSPAQDIRWLDGKLSRVLMLNPLGAEEWGMALKERVKRFQTNARLQADGSAGIDTIMALYRQTGEAPALKIERK